MLPSHRRHGAFAEMLPAVAPVSIELPATDPFFCRAHRVTTSDTELLRLHLRGRHDAGSCSFKLECCTADINLKSQCFHPRTKALPLSD